MRLIVFIWLFIFVSVHPVEGQEIQDTTLYKQVDKIPEFKGGLRAWQHFVSNEIDLFPIIDQLDSTQLVDFGIRQTAILEFTVCQDGEVCDVRVVNKDKVSPAFAEEAVRVMKASPKWSPGIYEQRAVRTRFRQNITAILKEGR